MRSRHLAGLTWRNMHSIVTSVFHPKFQLSSRLAPSRQSIPHLSTYLSAIDMMWPQLFLALSFIFCTTFGQSRISSNQDRTSKIVPPFSDNTASDQTGQEGSFATRTFLPTTTTGLSVSSSTPLSATPVFGNTLSIIVSSNSAALPSTADPIAQHYSALLIQLYLSRSARNLRSQTVRLLQS